MEPEHDSRNYEVYLSTKQVSSGIKDQWEKLKGSKASVIVSLFVNYEYKFHKFNAVGNAKPLEVASVRQAKLGASCRVKVPVG